MSSISTMTTLGAPAGAFTSNRGGALARRASCSVMDGVGGSAIGKTVRSSPRLAGCAAASVLERTISNPSIRTRLLEVTLLAPRMCVESSQPRAQ
jgi:hypothetical protein